MWKFLLITLPAGAILLMFSATVQPCDVFVSVGYRTLTLQDAIDYLYAYDLVERKLIENRERYGRNWFPCWGENIIMNNELGKFHAQGLSLGPSAVAALYIKLKKLGLVDTTRTPYYNVNADRIADEDLEICVYEEGYVWR